MEMANLFVFTFLVLGGFTCGDSNPYEELVKGIHERKLEKDSPFYEEWVSSSIPFYSSYYVFNVTNPEDVVAGMEPILKELGPYTFRQYRKKENIHFTDDGNVVQYSERKWFVFDTEKSTGSLSDNVTVLNVPFMIMAIKTEGTLTLMQQTMLPNVIRMFKYKPFVDKTVGEMLFQGYEDKFMAFLAKQARRDILLNDTYGYLYGSNSSSEGNYTIYTGNNDANKFMQIKYWNSSRVNASNDHHCSKINGSNGCFFPPSITKDDHLYMFSPSACRSIPLKYSEEHDDNGMKLYKFIPSATFLAGTESEANKCHDSNLKPGVISAETCTNSSILLSFPHFYMADESYYDSVHGLNRDQEQHETYFDLEPITGVVYRHRKTMQGNIAVKNVTHIREFLNFPNMVFPLFWIKETAELPDDFKEAMKKELGQ